MTTRVVCTAGHVDHGKSTLVRALTGMEPDRFEQEQRRGLTIDLGFAWTDLDGPSGPVTVSFVDLPGHERFIANMLTGAGPVEMALFVVAADEGWSAQSQEHLDILDVLGVSSGLVALTKCDLVDDAQLDAVRSDVRGRLAATSLADAEMVAVSAATGTGLDVLRTTLAALIEASDSPPDLGLPRLWVDRSFSIRGAGTVVTGTLGGGCLRVGDEVTLLPAGRRARIRGLQSLKAEVAEAAPGVRLAVNLAGVERADVTRGDLVTGGPAPAATAVDVWVRTVRGARIDRRGAWHLHVGAGEWVVGVTPLPDGEVEGEGFLRLSLDRGAPLIAGDRFVLRDAGRRATVGGGLILDCVPVALRGPAARRARVADLRERLAALRLGDRDRVLALHISERGADDARRAAAAVGIPAAALGEAVRRTRLLPLGSGLASPAAASTWTSAVVAALAAHHKAHPVDRSAPKDVAVRAAAAAGCPPALADSLVDVLIRLGRVAAEGTGVRQPDHRVRLDDRQAAARQALLDLLNEHPLQPPALSAAAAEAGATPALIREMETAGDLVRIAAEIALTAGAVDRAIALLRDAYAAEGPLTAARAKEIWGTTRKYAVPLLEHLDSRKVTRRRGDLRDVLA